jgi:hypothetical protein
MALTFKQEEFCRNIVKGMSYKDAYIDAYNSKGSDQNAYNEGSKLMLREDIQARVKLLSKPLETAAQQTALTEREKKRAVLWEIINTGDNNDKCRAMDILNKMDSEYVNVNVNDNRNAPDLSKLDLTALKDLV